MNFTLKQEGKFKFIEEGKGAPIILLHGLMGGLSNFHHFINFFKDKGYKVLMPSLPIYDSPIMDSSVKRLAEFLNEFIKLKELKNFVIIGNSLGGHVGLYYTKLFNKAKGLILTGSSGLYESAMGSGYTKRGDYNVIKKKVQEVFYNPKVATKILVDEIYETVNDRNKLIKIIAYAKSAIRHNMAKDLPKIKIPICLIWGKDDIVTPPDVANEFDKLLPNSDLYWIDKCGHAPMMEHPNVFNETVVKWFSKRNLNIAS
ncbi:MAG: alpha/beta hydrolase [Flavobacteriaceae bacterium]|nr:alpha/beta hydrolase [Flavobacteriaceae bacterium]